MAADKSTTPTSFTFIQREGRSEKLVAEVEIVFGEDAGVLFGIKLVGTCIWRSDPIEGEMPVGPREEAFSSTRIATDPARRPL